MTQIITNNGGGGGAGLYKYKGSVNSYDDLPTSGLKTGDVYNVVNGHTTAPVFPDGSNLAWTGTDWDVLGGNFDLSEYQEKLTEGDGIDLNSGNIISVEPGVITGAELGTTSIQPGDNITTLNNNAGFNSVPVMTREEYENTPGTAGDDKRYFIYEEY